MCSREQILHKNETILWRYKKQEKYKKKNNAPSSRQWISTSKIKDFNDDNNVEMFTSSVRVGKEFAAEQKIQELKSRITKLNALKMKSLLQK